MYNSVIQAFGWALVCVNNRTAEAQNNPTPPKVKPTPAPTPPPNGSGSDVPALQFSGIYDTTDGPRSQVSLGGIQTGSGPIANKLRILNINTINESDTASQDVIALGIRHFGRYSEAGGVIGGLFALNGGALYGDHWYLTDRDADGTNHGFPSQMMGSLRSVARFNCNTPDCVGDQVVAPFVADASGGPEPAD